MTTNEELQHILVRNRVDYLEARETILSDRVKDLETRLVVTQKSLAEVMTVLKEHVNDNKTLWFALNQLETKLKDEEII